MPNRSDTNRLTTFQYQFISMPDDDGGSCTALSTPPVALGKVGGNRRSARRSGLPDHPRRRPRPIGVRVPLQGLRRSRGVQPWASSQMTCQGHIQHPMQRILDAPMFRAACRIVARFLRFPPSSGSHPPGRTHPAPNAANSRCPNDPLPPPDFWASDSRLEM